MSHDASGPWRIVDQLRGWAESTPWCQWVELSGSLGRGAGDERSDVDAGIGVDAGEPFLAARNAAFVAVSGFAAVADSLIQPFSSDPPMDHLVIQYTDGRQLSLVVSLAHLRPGLPPGAQAIFDRTGQLSVAWLPDSLTASREQLREWAFLGWWALLDVTKHAARGSLWRAINSLEEARSFTWKLHAASLGVDYPTFGPVSVENAGEPAPVGLDRSLPAWPDAHSILVAADAVVAVLTPLTAELDVDRIRQVASRRLAADLDE